MRHSCISFIPIFILDEVIETLLKNITEDKFKSSFVDLVNKILEDKSNKWFDVSFIEENDQMVTIAKRYIRSYSKDEPITKTEIIDEMRKEWIKYLRIVDYDIR